MAIMLILVSHSLASELQGVVEGLAAHAITSLHVRFHEGAACFWGITEDIEDIKPVLLLLHLL